MNKKSNVPVILFVLGVFTVCSFALLTFFISGFNSSNSFVGITTMQDLNIQHEEYNFYLNKGVPESKVDTYFNVSQDVYGKYLFIEVNETKGLFWWQRQEVVFFAKQYLD